MKTLGETCHELEKVLSCIEDDCQLTLTSLDRFYGYVGSYAAGSLRHKLLTLGHWIIDVEKSHYREHDGHGHVCIFLSEARGMNVFWVESAEIVADKAWFEADGTKVLSMKEALVIIHDMLDELNAGNWARVVDWVKRYGKSSGLDFDKFL